MFRAAARTEWSQLRDYVSGAFFDVLPPATLRTEVARLSKNLLRPGAFADERDALNDIWRELTPSITVAADLPGPSLADGPQADAAHAVLVAFFRLVLGGETMEAIGGEHDVRAAFDAAA